MVFGEQQNKQRYGEVIEGYEGKIEGLEALNSVLVIKERQSNDELQDARKGLINVWGDFTGPKSKFQIKRMGELDGKPFRKATKQRFVGEEADVQYAMLCSKLQENLKDPAWHPFKRMETGDKITEVVDEEDGKLKKLREDWGEEVKDAIKTTLEELDECHPSGRYSVPLIWNSKENREATLKEAIDYMAYQIKMLKRKRT